MNVTLPLGMLSLLAVIAWLVGLPDSPTLSAGSTAWIAREHMLVLTGLWSVVLMSVTMALSTRPAWLEPAFGGLDRIYRAHRWTGILAVALAGTHWLVEMSDDIIKGIVGRTGRPVREHGGAWLETMRDVGEGLGEWAIYALLAMLAVTLWRRVPYRAWRWLHHAMPVLYLMAAFHAAFLAPLAWWAQPVGWVLGASLAIGSAAALSSLAGRIGRRRRVAAHIESIVPHEGGITELTCRLDPTWSGHRAGQFAFLTVDRVEGAHPFTISSADRGDRRITFQIKALGDYTNALDRHIRVGQSVTIEGPYGRFDFRRARSGARQIWVAGGIGVTPFLAWLESLQTAGGGAPEADLYYCTRQRDRDPLADRLEALCRNLPSIRLHIVSSDRDPALTAQDLRATQGAGRATDIWFCGPRPFGEALRNGLARLGVPRLRFHQEAFEMR